MLMLRSLRANQCCRTRPRSPAGQRLASPILFAPMAQQRLCHPDGELAMARAAAASGLPYVLSTMATASIQVCGVGVGEGSYGGWEGGRSGAGSSREPCRLFSLLHAKPQQQAWHAVAC